jgi:glycerol-3-phosphate dehydrogenase
MQPFSILVLLFCSLKNNHHHHRHHRTANKRTDKSRSISRSNRSDRSITQTKMASSSSSSSSSKTTTDPYDLVIVGGGVVGCAVLRAATLQGWKCALLESESDLLSHASGSNSGIACTGVDATPGTLERALIRDANSLFRIYCKDHNIPIRPCGSLVCSWPWDNNDNDNNDDTNENENKKEDEDDDHYDHDNNNNNLSKVYNESYEANDIHVQKLSSRQIKELEPNLSSNVKGGVHIKGEIVVDPWLYSISLAIHAKENGADIYTSTKFDTEQSIFDADNEIWNIVMHQQQQQQQQHDDDDQNDEKKSILEKKIQAKAIVNAAGLWSDTVQKQTLMKNKNKKNTNMNINNKHKTWNAKPRRGQYRIYNSNKLTSITHPIQPIPTQRTKGIFVFSSYYNQIVVGPTAFDQESKTDRSIDDHVANELDTIVKRIIPCVDIENDFVGEYVGIRPGTDKRDYQIHLDPRMNWIAVAGIRSTGLTASLGIGNYVVRNLHVILDDCELQCSAIKTTPLPSLETLIDNYQKRNDGCVEIHGFEYKVTHPLTKLGWSL